MKFTLGIEKKPWLFLVNILIQNRNIPLKNGCKKMIFFQSLTIDNQGVLLYIKKIIPNI